MAEFDVTLSAVSEAATNIANYTETFREEADATYQAVSYTHLYRKKQEQSIEKARLERYQQYIQEMEGELYQMNQKERHRLEEDVYKRQAYAMMTRTDSLYRQCTTDDGTFYAFIPIANSTSIPNGMTVDSVQSGPIIRADWLEELGLEVPQTIDDWTNVLTAFKAVSYTHLDVYKRQEPLF